MAADTTPTSQLRHGASAAIDGRTGFRGRRRARLRQTELVLHDKDGGALVIVKGFKPDLLRPLGKRFRASGVVEADPRGGWMRLFADSIEEVPGPSEVVIVRTFACQTCRSPFRVRGDSLSGYTRDMLGMRGQGFIDADFDDTTLKPCPDCDRRGYIPYQAKGYFAASGWLAAVSLAAAAVLGWLVRGA